MSVSSDAGVADRVPPTHTYPARHGSQSWPLVPPEYVPGGHRMHASASDARDALVVSGGEYDPGAHTNGNTDRTGQYVPRGHSSGDGEPGGQ